VVHPEPGQDDLARQHGWRHAHVLANGVRLHYVEAGNPDGELVLLLHGSPECWYSWRLQLGPLAERGLRAVAVDLRGFGQSDKPVGVAAYTLTTLAADVTSCVEQRRSGGVGLRRRDGHAHAMSGEPGWRCTRSAQDTAPRGLGMPVDPPEAEPAEPVLLHALDEE
jgi:hypothetical protein